MRNIIQALLFTFALAILPGCAKELPPIVGGYSDAMGTSEARKAAEFAVKQHAARSGEALALGGIVQAQRQIVAGSNYRMTLKVKSGREMRLAEVVVYQSLAPQLMLTSWQWLDK